MGKINQSYRYNKTKLMDLLSELDHGDRSRRQNSWKDYKELLNSFGEWL